MFDDINVRTLTGKQGDLYIHALDFAQHLVWVAVQMSTLPKTDNDHVKAMDFASVETLRMVARLLLEGEDVEYMRNNLDTYEDFLALADMEEE